MPLLQMYTPGNCCQLEQTIFHTNASTYIHLVVSLFVANFLFCRSKCFYMYKLAGANWRVILSYSPSPKEYSVCLFCYCCVDSIVAGAFIANYCSILLCCSIVVFYFVSYCVAIFFVRVNSTGNFCVYWLLLSAKQLFQCWTPMPRKSIAICRIYSSLISQVGSYT